MSKYSHRMFALAFLVLVTMAAMPYPAYAKLRVIVCSDIGGSDNDDFQSMVHFFVYADVFDVQGLISSPWEDGRKAHILEVINEYEKDYPNLITYSSDYPTPDALRAITKQGAIEITPAPGYSTPTEGSQWIVQCARSSDQPLYVLVWGCLDDVPQALHDAPDIVSKLRVYWIGGPNKKYSTAVYEYLTAAFPDLWFIEANTTYRGMFVGGNQSGDLGNSSFVSTHVRYHGALGDYFYAKRNSLKAGDTPSVLWALNNDVTDPTTQGWGGAFVPMAGYPNWWTDNPNPALAEGDYYGAKTVNIWREQFLRDFQARMDRCRVPNPMDTTPPTPDPMTWATAPYGANSTSIAMVATTATDTSGVEYFFDCTAGGGHDSAWQDSATYIDTGLTQGDTYSYQVKARDKSTNHNETGFSSVSSASPVADTTAPTPNPMTWAVVPAATGIDTIAMTASTATDASGVEYFFDCTSGGGHDSGWQDGTSYTDTGLTNNTTYAYRVIARDKSAGQNATGESEEASATTIRFTCSGPIETDFNGDCKVDFMDYATFAGTWGVEPSVFVNLVVNGDFATDLSGWNTSIAHPTKVQITWDAGTAKLARTVSDSTAPNANYLYQVIPVTNGQPYNVEANWKGDLTGTDRQWAEVYVGFVATGTIPPSAFGSMYYKKATYGGPNATPMPWDWGSILLSPNTSPVPPAGGIFMASNNYMVVAFNIGGRANAGTCYYNVDNVSVVEAGGTPCPEMDLNDDCAFDWLDIEVFVADWLDCNRNPGSECLE